MSTQHLRNIPLKLFRKFLKEQGCSCNRIRGGMSIGQDLIYEGQ